MDVDSRVEHVMVYRRGARITRHADLQAPISGDLTLPGLPLSLLDHSVRIAVVDLEGSGSARVSSLSVTLHARPRDEVEAEADVVRMRAAQRELSRMEQRRHLATRELELLRSVRMPDRPRGEDGKPPPPSPMEARVALDGFVHDGVTTRQGEILGLDREIVRLREEVAALRDAVARRDAAMRARPDEVTKAVAASIDVTGAPTRVRLSLTYEVPAARWVPVYQVHVDAAGAEVAVTLRAAVAQASGEPWTGVRLSLSTAEPQAFTALPELSSIRIGKAQPPTPPPVAFRAPPRGATALFDDFDRSRRLLAPHRPTLRSVPSVPDPVPIPLLPDVPRPRRTPAPTAETIAVEELEESLDDGYGEAPDDDEAMVVGASFSEAAPAPQVSRSPPRAAAPQKMEMRRERSAPKARRSGKGKKKADASRDVAFGGGGPGGAIAAEDAPEVDEAAPGLPAFATLRLPGSTDGDRGRLRPVDPATRYRRGLDRAVGFDVMDFVRRAEAAALVVDGLACPEGASWVGQGRFDYAYRGQERVDVPSEGEWHTVPILTAAGPCVMRYVVVPREDPSVFRVAAFPNPMRSPLLPGPVEVYVGGAYQLTGQLTQVPPGGTVTLGMGVEPAVRCARNTRFEEKRSGEQVVAMTELHHTVEVSLRNGLDRGISVEVRERIPQPGKGAEVAVEEETIDPAWTAYRQIERGRPVQGGRLWAVELPPAGTQTLSARYVVKIYANNEVVGGNRREA